MPIPGTYCPNSAGLTITGTLYRGVNPAKFTGAYTTGVFENAIVSIVYKVCKAPVLSVNANDTTSSPLYTYCSDGDLFIEQVTTDCSGVYTWSHTAKITGVALYVGPIILNPNWDCQNTTDKQDAYGNYVTDMFITDPADTNYRYCYSDNWDVYENGTITTNRGAISDLSPEPCECTCGAGNIPCQSTPDQTFPGTVADVYWSKSGVYTPGGSPRMSGLSGTITVDIYTPSYFRQDINLISLKDGKYYQSPWYGDITINDTCGNLTEHHAPPNSTNRSTSGYQAGVSTYNWSHVCLAGFPLLVVDVSLFAGSSVSSITYNGVNLVSIRSDTNGNARSELWYLVGPATGSNTIVVTLAGVTTSGANAASYTNINQSTPLGGNHGNNGTTVTDAFDSITRAGYNTIVVGAVSTTSTTADEPFGNVQSCNGALGYAAIAESYNYGPSIQTLRWTGLDSSKSWAVSLAYFNVNTLPLNDWWNITSVSFSPAPDCSNADGSGGIQVFPPFGRSVYPINNIKNPNTLCRCPYPTPLYALVADCSSTGVKFNASAYRESVAIAWITAANGLKVAVHHGVLGNVGNPTTGWEANQTIESANSNNVALSFLPNGICFLGYDLSSVNKYRTSNMRATGGWSATSAGSFATSGFGGNCLMPYQALAAQVDSGTCTLSYCRDGVGAAWASSTVSGSADALYTACAYMGGDVIVLYSTGSGADIKYRTCTDLNTVSFSSATSTGMTKNIVGLVYLPSGILAGLVWDSSSKRTYSCYSTDRGITWVVQAYYEEVIPALSIPPQLVKVADCPVAVWVTGDQPQFAVSLSPLVGNYQ